MGNMKNFRTLLEDEEKIASARKFLQKNFKKTQPGTPHTDKRTGKAGEVSFSHQGSGKKISGHFHGIKRMGGRSYAHVEPHKGQGRDVPNFIPLHHIHH